MAALSFPRPRPAPACPLRIALQLPPGRPGHAKAAAGRGLHRTRSEGPPEPPLPEAGGKPRQSTPLPGPPSGTPHRRPQQGHRPSGMSPTRWGQQPCPAAHAHAVHMHMARPHGRSAGELLPCSDTLAANNARPRQGSPRHHTRNTPGAPRAGDLGDSATGPRRTDTDDARPPGQGWKMQRVLSTHGNGHTGDGSGKTEKHATREVTGGNSRKNLDARRGDKQPATGRVPNAGEKEAQRTRRENRGAQRGL